MSARTRQDSSATTGARDALVLLRRQAGLFTKLVQLAEKQRRLVSQADTGPLMALLAERQRLTVGLTEISNELAPTRRDWVSTRDALTPAERVEADGLVTQVRERMRELIEGDERDAKVLAARKGAVARELRETRTIGQAVSAYRTTTPGSGRLDEAS